MNWGDLEGLQHHDELALAAKKREAELKEIVPDRKQRWDHQTVDGAESYNVLAQRMRQQLSQIAENHPGEKILVFSHGRAIFSFVIDAEDNESVIDGLGNCSVVHMTFDPAKSEKPFCFHRVEHSPN
jgi:broad specificity phosphatase PhoE